MATVETELPASSQRLLREIASLSTPDLDRFLDQALTLRAERRAPHLSEAETRLLEKINSGFSPETQKRFNQLVVKRRAYKITTEELAELITLTNQSEAQAAERIQAAAELARLRGISFDEMWRQLKV